MFVEDKEDPEFFKYSLILVNQTNGFANDDAKATTSP